MHRDQEMTRYYEYMRPRYTNPTYASSNVGATMGLLPIKTQYRPTPRVADYGLAREAEPVAQSQTFQNQPKTPVQEEPRIASRHQRSKSLMSSYGNSSLGHMPRVVNQRDIYEKQEKKYNIITIQPKEYQETIKKYPKYHLENQDQNYYRKLQIQDEYNKLFESRYRERHPSENPENYASKPSNMPATHAPTEEKPQAFRPKMLNNIDQLGGVL